MQKNLILQRGSAAVSTLIMAGLGLTGAASAATINDTGPNSSNVISGKVDSNLNMNNKNWLDIMNGSWQGAFSGDAKVHHNTNAGSAITGNATNNNASDFGVAADNGGSGDMGSGMGDWSGNMGGGGNGGANINDTGPDSSNKITGTVKSEVNVKNTNNVAIDNSNSQLAASGDANVSDNTDAGSARTGAATNNNNTAVDVTASNNAPTVVATTGSSGLGGGANISDTGPDSSNAITANFFSNTKVTNANDVSVSNSNSQQAASGDANVSDNTNAGSARTGAATNNNSTSIMITATNG